MEDFINRNKELSLLEDEFTTKNGLGVVYGRRRVGKTTLLEHWGRSRAFYYSQAIEADPKIQIEQLAADLKGIIPPDILVKDWPTFLRLLSMCTQKCVVCIDEFPWLVSADRSLPSRLQKWIDHDRPKDLSLILLGSSQTMTDQLFFSSSSPLYDRANLLLKVEPMGYKEFVTFTKKDPLAEETMLFFSVTGGVPKYWELIGRDETVLEFISRLFFDKHALLATEPDRLLKDEQIGGQSARTILELIGRGARRPSEIASRIELPQTALSKPLMTLSNCSLVSRVTPFGMSARTSKKNLYVISDPTLRFWFGVYSPHRTRWKTYGTEKKLNLVRDHAGSTLEWIFRQTHEEAAPYWDGKVAEFDCVRFNKTNSEALIVSEIKFGELSQGEINRLEKKVRHRFAQSKLAKSYELSVVEVLDRTALAKMLLHQE